MRNAFMFNLVSLDGCFEGANREIDWHNVDAEFNEYALEMLNSADTLLFGRVTYELMAGYWPTPDAIKNDPIVAERMNSLPKIVFSKTLEKGNNAEEISKLKRQPGKDIVIYGNGSIVSAPAQLGLIDEYRIFVNPIVLGSGKPLFKGLNDRLKLKLLGTKTFHCGVALLHYQRDTVN
jgi:dihydrofolate reductase